MQEPASAAPPADTDYSLSEAPNTSALHALAALAGSLKEGQLRLCLALADLTEQNPHHTVSISTREISKAANLSESALPAALKALAARNLITIRHGRANRKNAYQVNFISTVRASFREAPQAKPASFGEAPVPLFERHPASFREAPPTENKALPHRADPLDSSRALPPILDRVLKSKVSDFDKTTVDYFRRALHAYMGKFGRDDDNQRHLDTGAKPHPPDNEVVARFLSVDAPHRLMPLIENLACEAERDSKLQPHSYGWFVTVALSRLGGIHWTATKKAEQQFRLHKRGQRQPAAPAAEQSGLDFAAEITARATAGAKSIR